MKCHILFFEKNKKNNSKYLLLKILRGYMLSGITSWCYCTCFFIGFATSLGNISCILTSKCVNLCIFHSKKE